MSNAGNFALAPQYIHTAAVAIGVGTTINTRGYKNCILEVSSVGTSSFTVKVQGAIGTGSLGDVKPTFGSTKSTTNPWDYIEIIDVEDGTAIDGDTGVAFVAADVRLFELNISAFDYMNVDISAWASGSVTVRTRLYTND